MQNNHPSHAKLNKITQEEATIREKSNHQPHKSAGNHRNSHTKSSFLIIGTFPCQMPFLSTIITFTTTPAAASTTISPTTASTAPKFRDASHTTTLSTVPCQMSNTTAVVALTAAAPTTSAVTATPSASSRYIIPSRVSTKPSITASAASPSISTTTAAAVKAGTAGLSDISNDVDGFGASVLTEIYEELDGLALREGPEAVGLDRGLVDEEILTAVVGSYEAEPLMRAEPLDRARGFRGVSHGGEGSRSFLGY